jgi:copper chaperone CopZ
VDIPGKKVTVEYDESRVDIGRIKQAVEDEEYPVASVQ